MSAESKKINPDWIRDEEILLLDLYLSGGNKVLRKTDPRVIKLSKDLNALYPETERSATFRNPSGISRKLGNVASIDPLHSDQGKKGNDHASKLLAKTWDEFAHDPERLHQVAQAIRSCMSSSDANTHVTEETEIEEASEGKLLTRTHIARERNSAISKKKKQKVLKDNGKLGCEACGFVFEKKYGERGQDFIECHHTKPLTEYKGEQKTKLEDLALLCANCHRMIHAKKPWLTVEQLKEMICRTN